MFQQNDVHAQDMATTSHTQEQREHTALMGNALRLQELFVALWEAKRYGQPFACPDHPDLRQPG